ncbi:MAG: zinc-dependent alcohol dehydrogenase family protein [Burkholderiales bacterium]|nr:zinc-dependent alcohol dehydrogenase family protein [Burkholderiales bacterium]
MRAMLMTGAGSPLSLAEVAKPELSGPHDLLVRLLAAGVNPVDAKLRRRGTYYPENLPCILGLDGAGVVESVGAFVSRFKAGDEVFFLNGGIGGAPGNYAEYACVHEDFVAHKPASISMEEAAAIPLVFITAWESLFDRAGLAPGQSVLVHGGAGGVGHVAIQIAKYCGAKVAATVSSGEKAQFAGEIGADFAINYLERDFVQAILDWTNGQGVDVVLDTAGGETFCRSFAAIRFYGRLVTLLDPSCSSMKEARTRNLNIGYELMLTPLFYGLHAQRLAQRAMLEAASQMMDEGRLEIRVAHVFPLEAANAAHAMIESGHTTGKIVLDISS